MKVNVTPETANLLKEVKEYVEDFYQKFQPPELSYHNLEHTRNVVSRTFEISNAYALEEQQLLIILIASWFHDTGQLFGDPKYHEEKSTVIMKDFLTERKVEPSVINAIEGCILATKLPQKPHTLLEEIVCDADTYNLGTKDFLITDKLLKREHQYRNKHEEINWEENTLELFKEHKYFTTYCRDVLTKGKEINQAMVEEKVIARRQLKPPNS